MDDSRIRDNFRCEYTIRIAGFRRHQAVGRKQDRSRNVSEFFLLIVPCGTEISFQMRISFQFRICVCRKHLTVGIDIDSFSFCLFQKKLQVFQVVPADHDKRSFFYCEGNSDRNRITVGLCVCLIQKRHAFQVDLAHFHYKGEELLHVQIFADGKHSFIEESVDFFVGISQYHSVVRICRHSSESEQNQRFQGTDIFICIPEKLHIIIFRPAAGLRAGSAPGGKGVFLSCYIFNLLTDCIFVKVYVGNGCEQSLDHCSVSGRRGRISAGCPGKADQGACKFILKSGHVRSFPAYAGIPCASGTSCSLFTLKTKHFI